MKVDNNFRQYNINSANSAKTALNKKENQTNFTGISPVEILKFLDTNQAWGANFVDFGFMVLPRTATDFTRGADAGWETGRRESMGTINDSSVGLYGSAAGLALASGLNKAYDLGSRDMKLSSIFADSETIDMMGKIWHEELPKSTKDPLLLRLKKTLGNYQVYDGEKWVQFKPEDIDKAARLIHKEVKSYEHLSKETKYDVIKILTSSHNLENNFRIIAEKGKKVHSSRYSIASIVENTFKLSKIFSKETVVEAFNDANGDIRNNKFIKSLKKMNRNRSLWGVGIATLVGTSTQPINMYLTKRKTGKDNFVGGGEKDSSFKFKAEKALVATLFGLGVIATIGKPSELIKNLQFKGFSPTINQLKFIYGATIFSRFLAARNENELKESSVKDILGFTNWLILGNFVQKLVAQAFDSSLIKQEKVGGILDWIRTSSLKTRDEVLHSFLGKDAFKNGKALGFREMIKAIQDNPVAKKKLAILTGAQLAGYAYSGLVLGLGIPKLNIYLTGRRMAKQKAREEALKKQNQAIQPKVENNKDLENLQNKEEDRMLNADNINFLRQFTGTLSQRMSA